MPNVRLHVPHIDHQSNPTRTPPNPKPNQTISSPPQKTAKPTPQLNPKKHSINRGKRRPLRPHPFNPNPSQLVSTVLSHFGQIDYAGIFVVWRVDVLGQIAEDAFCWLCCFGGWD